MEARHHGEGHLTEHALPRSLVENSILVTTELVTNAVLHGAGPIELRLRTNGHNVLLEVQDRATFRPRMLRPTAEDKHGRRLEIVAALATRWGGRATEDGKSVWCLLSP